MRHAVRTARSPGLIAALLSCMLGAWPVSTARAADLEGARAALRAGRYDEARQALRDDKRPEAALLRAALSLATGQYDELVPQLASLRRRASPLGRRARLLTARAHLRRGRDAQAMELLRGLARAPDGYTAQLLLGRLHMERGRAAEAQRWLGRLVDAYNAGRIANTDASGLAAVAQAAYLLGATRDANETFVDATSAAPEDDEIQLAWADLFLDKYDPGHAGEGLKQVLRRNPSHARALERMARALLDSSLDFDEARKLLDRALTVNPNLVAAHVTRAGIALREMDLAQADAHLDRALAVNPRDLEALSVRAATRFLADDDPGLQRAERAVLAVHPRFSRMYSIIAKYAEWEHRYEELVQLADRALALDPDDALAHATRGLNLLRTGREAEGLEALRQAWRRDRYNVLVYNTLNLYDDVIGPHYESYREAPFQIRVHKRERAVLEPYVGPLAREAYASMKKRYGITPEGPLHLEFYAEHEHFSVRTSGLPNLGVQGVCFGKVLTALSPAGGEFNWGQILWHELAHIFHIQLARSRVPRWFTEGLAEVETVLARPEWKREDERMVYDAFVAGRLPPLSHFNRAFTHARSPQDLMIAYYASYLAVDFLVDRFGFDKLVQMLRLWGQSVPTRQVFKRAVAMDLDALDRDFQAHLAQRFRRYQDDFRVELRRVDDLAARKQRALAPDASAGDRSAFAAALAAEGELDEAARCARKALELDAREPVALFVLAHVALSRGDLPDAQRALHRLLAAGKDGYQLRMLLARIAMKQRAHAEALRQLEAAIKIDDQRSAAYRAMRTLAKSTKNEALETRAVLALSALDQHARAPLHRALELLSAAGRHRELVTRALAGIYLDPASPHLHALLAEGLAHTGHARRGLTYAARAVQLAGQGPQAGRSQLAKARVLAALGRDAEARAAARAAVDRDPSLQEAAGALLSR